MNDDAIPHPVRKTRRPGDRYRQGRRIALQVIVAATFVAAVYWSGRLGVKMAANRLPEGQRPAAPAADEEVVLGESGDPIYLSETTESLRGFFAAYPTEEERAAANLGGLGIRRLGGTLEMTVVRAEADAIQVRISSGAMAGAQFWIHHSQMPGPSAFDPIISPVPTEGN